jgi:hypothetical protein
MKHSQTEKPKLLKGGEARATRKKRERNSPASAFFSLCDARNEQAMGKNKAARQLQRKVQIQFVFPFF